MPQKPIDFDKYLEKIEGDLEALRNKSDTLDLNRLMLLQAITLLKLLRADNYQTTTIWLKFKDFATAKDFHYHNQSLGSFVGNYVSSFFYAPASDYDSQQAEINSFFNGINLEETVDDDWLIIDLEDSSKETSIPNAEYKNLLQTLIQLHFILEQLAIEFDKTAKEIQARLPADNNLLEKACMGRPEAPRLSKLLIAGAKLRYGNEENRDNLSTVSLDQYKFLLAQELAAVEGTRGALERAIQKCPEDGPKIELRNLAIKIRDIEVLYGNCTAIFDQLKMLAAADNSEKFEINREMTETLLNESPLPKAAKELFTQALKEISSQQSKRFNLRI